MADIQGLRRDINAITERADNMIAFDKKKNLQRVQRTLNLPMEVNTQQMHQMK